MASLTLKNIKKIYPHNGDEGKQAKKAAKAAGRAVDISADDFEG